MRRIEYWLLAFIVLGGLVLAASMFVLPNRLGR